LEFQFAPAMVTSTKASTSQVLAGSGGGVGANVAPAGARPAFVEEEVGDIGGGERDGGVVEDVEHRVTYEARQHRQEVTSVWRDELHSTTSAAHSRARVTCLVSELFPTASHRTLPTATSETPCPTLPSPRAARRRPCARALNHCRPGCG
jgi:hypothetical protein